MRVRPFRPRWRSNSATGRHKARKGRPFFDKYAETHHRTAGACAGLYWATPRTTAHKGHAETARPPRHHQPQRRPDRRPTIPQRRDKGHGGTRDASGPRVIVHPRRAGGMLATAGTLTTAGNTLRATAGLYWAASATTRATAGDCASGPPPPRQRAAIRPTRDAGGIVAGHGCGRVLSRKAAAGVIRWTAGDSLTHTGRVARVSCKPILRKS